MSDRSSARGFPPYAYVPRMFPHPSRDAGGHSLGMPEAEASPLTPERWADCAGYLHGIELFNHGYYWEAHEAWEGVWHAIGRSGAAADFLKALIKLAAAGVKAREGNEAGMRRAALRAEELFLWLQMAVPDGAGYCGLNLEAVAAHAREVAARASDFLNTDAQPVVVVFPFRLETVRHAD